MSSSITILGSTGSIGQSTLRVIKTLEDKFRVYGLSCYGNLDLLDVQIAEVRPRVVAVGSDDAVISAKYKALKAKYSDVEFLDGEDGIAELACRDTDILVSAIVGAAGLYPTIKAIPHVKRIAIANKETLVMAGDLFTGEVKKHGVELLPVDSEHSAIFFLLQNVGTENLKRVIITASGGSLRDKTLAEMQNVTPAQALAHPTWNMGAKITIDSATLVNKGLEVIECHHLFGIDYDKIDVIIHPESIIHSMVETKDGAVFAYMSAPDMAHTIIKALTYPDKIESGFGTLDLLKNNSLTFRGYDSNRFPALELCYYAGRTGGTMPAVLNGANEIAVNAFLTEKISFTNIVKVVEKTMNKHKPVVCPNLDDIFDADIWARKNAQEFIQ